MKTLLIVYVHGFKGDSRTFLQFPQDVENRLKQIYESAHIESVVYPTYDTKGELTVAVNAFLSFLETRVIDIEVANGTESPVVSPTVGVILVGHSMGGLVIADTTIEILTRDPKIVFPNVIGLMCFDSPFLGLHSSVFAQDVIHRGAAKFNELKALGASVPIASVTSFLFAKKSSEQPNQRAADNGPASGTANDKPANGTAKEKSANGTANDKPASDQKSKTNWGKIAGLTVAGVATTAAATAGAVWYLKSQNVDVNWAKDHLLFVGAIFQKPQPLKSRLWTFHQARERVQFINYYTVVQPKEAAQSSDTKDATQVIKSLGKIVSGEGDGKRTFCNVPKEPPYTDFFVPAENNIASGEIEAHMNMFESGKNAGYSTLLDESVEKLNGWVSQWMQS
ncbi:hypothetical protein V1525DRAFT_411575 [Lipomyces kononenkoae]|uniref:Uncharacterized protein n=1 Tax=Lipomyces kononenkoae TaxID=34357 RepID=A0ACC3SVV7_LIPKO